ncbi:pancreatic triacylglycerol lipase-like [Diorhabda sublineata]|uniref:pancreatic triacylglycerol lipase-like n=1 Tax=Diorhabda sublineata TaxID=1163346 RepID=UPI0024E0B820|nr:pancreatic triacylglycerol lipase-like [Diorhabda sublineata]
MKLIIAVLFSLSLSVESQIPCIFRESTASITGYDVNKVENVTVSNDDVKFYFKSQQYPDGIGPIDLNDTDAVLSTGFSHTKPTAFVVHGWRSSHKSEIMELVPKAFTDTKDINVFVVDWSSIARKLYTVAYKAVPEIGVILADNIKLLMTNYKLKLDKTAIIGHSLGAHVSGLAGQALEGKVRYIEGLDPALPCFSYEDLNGRLDASDAKYVEIIHTNAGLLGFDVDLGHADFYPNGGKSQPGCSALDVTGSCSHGRSYKYYAESIVSGGFVSKRCDSYKDFEEDECSGPTTTMGEFFLKKSLVIMLSATMSKIVIFLSLFVLVTSDSSCVFRESTSAITGNVSNPHELYNVSESDINFYFKNQKNPDGVGPLYLNDSDSVNSAGFSADKDTVFVVHGWQNDHTSPICSIVPKALTDTVDVNVFVVDWGAISYGMYLPVFEAVPTIGKILGNKIQYLVNNNNLNLSTTAVVGHSLGAHVAGLAGKALGGKINYIIGLDPALPCFSYEEIDNRLAEYDALYVEIIHTCGGLLGFNVSIGDSDYYPNGGSDQPGCPTDDFGSCSHGRSYEYYAESIVSGGFISKSCESYADFQKNNCANDTSYMGEYVINKKATGDYFLSTNSVSPYAKN